ncbi:MAG: DeoR/GlpR transcriptional regulator [Candidatus Latescibacteria bacterium]|nr:DeoR/GlpR transcriptional regulator [Candidatus Latescibacterota bacterium]
MKPQERQKEILAILRAMQKEFHVDELAEILGVSSLTIRRDLHQLFMAGAIIRTHGGCLASGRASMETGYYKKVALNFDLKQAIGKTARHMVKSGDVVLINDGSTTYHLATYIGETSPLTVYTNSLAMIAELSRYDHVKLHILGGEYNPDLYSLSGSLTEHMLELLHFDTVFLGVDAIDNSGRCMVGSSDEARLTQVMLRSGTQKILLADHTKTGKKGYISYGNLNDFDIWITTPGMKKELMKEFNTMTHIVEAAR